MNKKVVELIIEESELGAGMAMMIGFGYMVDAVMMCYTPGLWCIYFKEVV